MKCKQCKEKDGYKLTAKGCHTVMKIICKQCGVLGTHWPDRHFRKVTNK